MSDSRPSSVSDDRRADQIFLHALDLPRRERSEYLDRECADRPHLRALVEDLLRTGSDDWDPLLDGGRERQARWLQEAEGILQNDVPMERLGPYRLLWELGRGGMGVVYLAERADGAFEQRVALKLIQQGAGASRRQRFLRERQILASLEHPGIARLLDGGVTAEGQLYLVMERVDGEAIDQYCDDQQLPLVDRIRLFLEVCAAVSAAHRQLVVHRDLKPSNILVSGEGGVKLLDFGIAKLLDPESGKSSAEVTRAMTPSYASPEQFLGESITVASDVYQLGLLLYRLLVGRLPYDFDDASVASAAKWICEVPAPRPSTVLRSRRREEEEAGRPVAFDPASVPGWERTLRGDLDNIVAKALAKAPDERYPSVDALAADLERYLVGQPVAARRPTFSYVAGKLILRHRWAVLSAVAALAVIVSLVAGYTVRLRQERDRSEVARVAAEQARAEAETLSRSLVDLFELSDPERRSEEAIDALGLLDRSVERVRSDLGAHPLTSARFLHTIGEIYTKLARFESAAGLVEEALAMRENQLPADDPVVIQSVNQLGVILSRLQRFEEAEELLERSLQARERGSDEEALAVTLNNLGNLRWRQGRLAEAEGLHRRALELRESAAIPDPVRIGDSANNLGVLLNSQGHHQEAVPYLQRAADAHGEAFGTEHPTPAIALNNLGIAQQGLGRWAAAEDLFRRAAVAWRAAYGPTHPRTLRAETNLGTALRRQGKLESSLEVYQAVLTAQEAEETSDGVEVARTLSLMGRSQIEAGDLGVAERSLRRSIALRRELVGAEHVATSISETFLARVHRLQGEREEAERILRRVEERIGHSIGESSVSAARIWHELGLTAMALGRPDEAESWLRRAVETRRELLPADHPQLLAAEADLASLSPSNPS